jgi:hypothetical protein
MLWWRNFDVIVTAIMIIITFVIVIIAYILSFKYYLRITGEAITSPITEYKYFDLVPVMMTIEISNIEKIEIKKKYKNSEWIAYIKTKRGSDLNIHQNAVNDWKKFIRVLSEEFDGIVDVVVVVPTFKSYDHINYQNQKILYEEKSGLKKIVVFSPKYLGIPISIIILIVSWLLIILIALDIPPSTSDLEQELHLYKITVAIICLLSFTIPFIMVLIPLYHSQLPKITDFGVYPSMPIIKDYKFISHNDIRKALYYNDRIEFKVINPKKLLKMSEAIPAIYKRHCSNFKKVKKILKDLNRYEIK